VSWALKMDQEVQYDVLHGTDGQRCCDSSLSTTTARRRASTGTGLGIAQQWSPIDASWFGSRLPVPMACCRRPTVARTSAPSKSHLDAPQGSAVASSRPILMLGAGHHPARASRSAARNQRHLVQVPQRPAGARRAVLEWRVPIGVWIRLPAPILVASAVCVHCVRPLCAADASSGWQADSGD
jgi:hypothetical protein